MLCERKKIIDLAASHILGSTCISGKCEVIKTCMEHYDRAECTCPDKDHIDDSDIPLPGHLFLASLYQEVTTPLLKKAEDACQTCDMHMSLRKLLSISNTMNSMAMESMIAATSSPSDKKWDSCEDALQSLGIAQTMMCNVMDITLNTLRAKLDTLREQAREFNARLGAEHNLYPTPALMDDFDFNFALIPKS